MPPFVMPPSIAPETPIARMERIAKAELPQLPGPPIDIPESPEKRREDIDRWKAMAQGYASICIRQLEFEHAMIANAKAADARMTRIEAMLESITIESTIDAATVTPASTPPVFDDEAPTRDRT